MPKENRSTSRRSRRLSGEYDNNEHTVSVRDSSAKSAITRNRYSPFPRDSSRRESSRTSKEKITMEASGGIIENGIKYIMFPLHLLRFCIFGTSTSERIEPSEERSRETKDYDEKKEGREERKKREETKDSLTKETKNQESVRDKKESRAASPDKKHGIPSEEIKKIQEESEDSNEDGMVTAEEDSDSSGEQWWTPNSCMVMHMSVDNDHFERSMSYALFEEPMDVSMEEQTCEQGHNLVKTSENLPGNRANSSSSSRSLLEERDSNGDSSVDEEISRIFQKQCTSSEDELPSPSFPKSFNSCKLDGTREKNFLYNGIRDKSVGSRMKKSAREEDERERRKKTTTEFVGNNKRRKVTHDEDRNEDYTERRKERKIREEKHSSPRDTPSKYRSRSSRNSSRTPVKSRESKGRETRFKETATQTDSAFSDDDVEMVPVDAKLSSEKFCCKHAVRKSLVNLYQDKDAKKELNYVADNEDTNDGFLRIKHKRVSSCSTSSSSTDLGFDERISATPENDAARLLTNSPDTVSAFRPFIRAPPGFPELPQNPPLTPSNYIGAKRFPLSSRKEYITSSTVPPAPSPMPHLYYDYPEFMDLPANVRSSKILRNILKNNYHR